MSATASDLREDLAARTTRCQELEGSVLGLTSTSEAQEAHVEQLGERQRALEAEVEGLHMSLEEARGRVSELEATVVQVPPHSSTTLQSLLSGFITCQGS